MHEQWVPFMICVLTTIQCRLNITKQINWKYNFIYIQFISFTFLLERFHPIKTKRHTNWIHSIELMLCIFIFYYLKSISKYYFSFLVSWPCSILLLSILVISFINNCAVCQWFRMRRNFITDQLRVQGVSVPKSESIEKAIKKRIDFALFCAPGIFIRIRPLHDCHGISHRPKHNLCRSTLSHKYMDINI